jgi:acetyl esterase/lipase
MTPHDPMNADADDARLAEMCFGDRPLDDPEVSPALDHLAHLPPTYIEVGDREVLLGDALALHLRAAADDASCRLHISPGLLHMGQLWAPWWPPAAASLDRAAGFLRPLLVDEVG